MASISLVCYNGFFSCNDNLGPVVGKTGLGRKVIAFHSSVLGSSSLLVGITRKPQGFVFCSSSQWKPVCYCRCGSPSAGFGVCYNSRLGVSCKSRIGTLRDGGGGASRVDEPTRLARRRRRRFSLRLRPRFRLLMMRLKTFSVRSMLDDYGTFLKKNGKRGTVYALVSAVFWLCYFLFRLTASPSSKIVPYSELIASLQDGRVSKVLVEEGSRRIYYNAKAEASGSAQNSEGGLAAVNVSDEQVANTIAEGDTVAKGKLAGISILKKKFSKPRASAPEWQFSTRKIDHDEKFLLSLMRERGTSYSSAPQSALVSMRNALITIIMLWIPLTPLMWLLHRQLSGGNSLAKKRKPKNQIVTFDDVEGVDIAKVELMEVVSCLQGAASYQKLGAKLPRGVLLSGPPGTGKTLLARAVAGEAGVPFFSVSASEFVEMFVGRGAARIRDLFNVARKNAPSIIFIDELDAVGGKRGRSFNDERDQTLNQLLTEMDGFESDMKVVVIAATNRPQALDPALCRPGRFSRKILVAEPDEEGRRKILAVHLREVPLEEDPDLICALVASLTPGFVGADLANIVNESALLAARRGREEVTREDVMEAIERAKFGITERQLRPSTITKELGKLFPWMPSSLTGKNVGQNSYEGGPLGYQSLS